MIFCNLGVEKCSNLKGVVALRQSKSKQYSCFLWIQISARDEAILRIYLAYIYTALINARAYHHTQALFNETLECLLMDFMDAPSTVPSDD